jgi:Kelch motif
MPIPRGALTANFVDEILYAVGGVDEFGVSDSNIAYNPNTEEWAVKSPLPTAREHLASAVVNGKLYVVGGRAGGIGSNFDANEMYDPVKNTWATLESMPSKRGGSAAASVYGNIYVFGGEEPGGTFNNNEKYDPRTNNLTD